MTKTDPSDQPAYQTQRGNLNIWVELPTLPAFESILVCLAPYQGIKFEGLHGFGVTRDLLIMLVLY